MNVLIRVDASIDIGTGHVMRCLTLANKLKKKGVNIIFLCRNLKGNLCNIIQKGQFSVITLPEPDATNIYIPKITAHSDWLGVPWYIDAQETINIIKNLKYPVDLLIVDHYAIDINWEKEVGKYVKKIMVIDDLADRLHYCDFLLDQNYYSNLQDRYVNLVPKHCKLFLGPKYVLLRDEFYTILHRERNYDSGIKRIFVFFGGTDPTNETKKAIDAFLTLNRFDIILEVVVGKSNIHKSEIEQLCSQYSNINYYCQVDNMAELMNNSDLAIGAGGTTTWERCYLGLPSIVITIAENQHIIAQELHKQGAIKYLGTKESVTISDLHNQLEEFINNPDILRKMSKLSKEIMLENYESSNMFINQIFI
jgi:UDP-2,4-diacetamido-2,4,6-trideoxy-beta-L-altropyranose hydrolase